MPRPVLRVDPERGGKTLESPPMPSRDCPSSLRKFPSRIFHSHRNQMVVETHMRALWSSHWPAALHLQYVPTRGVLRSPRLYLGLDRHRQGPGSVALGSRTARFRGDAKGLQIPRARWHRCSTGEDGADKELRRIFCLQFLAVTFFCVAVALYIDLFHPLTAPRPFGGHLSYKPWFAPVLHCISCPVAQMLAILHFCTAHQFSWLGLQNRLHGDDPKLAIDSSKAVP